MKSLSLVANVSSKITFTAKMRSSYLRERA